MINLIGKRNYFFALSIIIILAGVIGFFAFGGTQGGVVLDIQFEGGTVIQIEMPDDNYDPAVAEKIVRDTIDKTAIVQKASTYNVESSGSKTYLMNLKIGSKETLSQEDRSKVIAELKKGYNLKEDAQTTVNSIEPFIGAEIMRNGLLAVFWSSLLIIVYVWWRFKVMSGLPAGVVAVLALIHDILIMLVVYILFRLPLNDSFIAAVLTVIGFSMNDTIIIYDRIRENSRLLRKISIAELVNTSVVQTLNRSINTTVTVLICIITVFIYASVHNIQSIREFTFPLVIGLTSGVYSTIFIASSLYVMWMEHQQKKKVVGKPAKSKA